MATWCVTHAKASETAAKPPSTTNTHRRLGRQRRTCLIGGRTQSILVVCRRWVLFAAGQHSTLRNGNAHTRRAHGTGIKSIIETHFKPKQRMTCFLAERTASRSQPVT